MNPIKWRFAGKNGAGQFSKNGPIDLTWLAKPAIAPNNVDLPQPEGPRIAKNSPTPGRFHVGRGTDYGERLFEMAVSSI
jgi:hypothetical protein